MKKQQLDAEKENQHTNKLKENHQNAQYDKEINADSSEETLPVLSSDSDEIDLPIDSGVKLNEKSVIKKIDGESSEETLPVLSSDSDDKISDILEDKSQQKTEKLVNENVLSSKKTSSVFSKSNDENSETAATEKVVNESKPQKEKKIICKLPLHIPNNNSPLITAINGHDFKNILVQKKEIRNLSDEHQAKLFTILKTKIILEIKQNKSENLLICLKIINNLLKHSHRQMFNQKYLKELKLLKKELSVESIGLNKIIYLKKKLKESKRVLNPAHTATE